jgi:hypothetical protein
LGSPLRSIIFAAVIIFTVSLAVTPVLAQTNSTDDLLEKFQGTIGNWLNFFEVNVSWISTSFLDFMKHVIKATYFTIGVLGFVLWASGISRFSGKRLLLGAVALALISEILL